jgi:hypothetical protein
MKRAGLAIVVGALLTSPSVAQATLTLNPTILDDPSGPGSCPSDPCSLRQAVSYVQAAGGGTVSLMPPAPQGTYVEKLNSISVPGSVAIVGPGPRSVTIENVGSGAGNHVFYALPGPTGTVSISGVTITGGINAALGGAIRSDGNLNLSDVAITGNTSGQTFNHYSGHGGGVSIDQGQLTISDSTISGNTAATGGGIYMDSNSSAVISDSTIAGNMATTGGGIHDPSHAVTLTNVTLADNTATQPGGTGGNWAGFGALTAKNTIIAGGSATTAGTENCGGGASPYVTAGTHNLEDRNQCGLTGAGDLINTDPLLGSLGNNGGNTDTLLIGAKSPAIDAGAGCVDATGAPLTHDQRGVTRPQGPACDIGAFEREAPPNTKIGKATINQQANSATFAFKATGTGKQGAAKVSFQCALVKGKKKPAFKACTSPKRYKHLKKGRYKFEVRAFDSAGKDPTPAKKKFRIK